MGHILHTYLKPGSWSTWSYLYTPDKLTFIPIYFILIFLVDTDEAQDPIQEAQPTVAEINDSSKTHLQIYI